jgi:glutathione S-transferase
MLTLYLSPGFSSMAPHIALHEIGVDFESRWISFAKREQYAPESLALNPEGKVPILLVDGRPLTEVAAILYYLAGPHNPRLGHNRLDQKGKRARENADRGPQIAGSLWLSP